MFGCRVYRVPLDGGFTCPNRDGGGGRGGCLYFDVSGSAARPEHRGVPVREQMQEGIEWLRRRFGARRFLAYFQSFTNTYAPVERLRELWNAALDHSDGVGWCVGTRPDCVPDPVLDLVAGYARARGLQVCVHLILGFPGEGVKLHMLHILRGIPLGRRSARDPFPFPSRAQSVGLVVDFLERLHPRAVIHRLAGEAAPGRLLAPAWCLDKHAVLAAIREEMDRRPTWQGRRFRPA